MTKEKKSSLIKYKALLADRLVVSVPIKHLSRPIQYREFISRELATVTAQLEAAKLEGGK